MSTDVIKITGIGQLAGAVVAVTLIWSVKEIIMKWLDTYRADPRDDSIGTSKSLRPISLGNAPTETNKQCEKKLVQLDAAGPMSAVPLNTRKQHIPSLPS